MVPANELENKMNRRQRVNDRAYLEPNNITDLCFDVLGEMSVLNASRKRQQVYILAKTRVVVPSDFAAVKAVSYFDRAISNVHLSR